MPARGRAEMFTVLLVLAALGDAHFNGQNLGQVILGQVTLGQVTLGQVTHGQVTLGQVS